MSNPQSKSFPYLYRIRAIACFAIVVLHTFSVYAIVNKGSIDGITMDFLKLIPYLMTWAVPCFIMVSGALLLDPSRPMSVKKILRKYVLRMLIVLLVFTVLYFLLDCWMNHDPFEVSDSGDILGKFFTDGSWAHLWYLYLLIGLYLLLPFFRMIYKNLSPMTAQYGMIVCLLFLSIVPSIERWFDISVGFTIPISSIFILYLFFGILVHDGVFKLSKIAAWICVGVGIGMITILTFCYSGDKQSILDKLLGNYAFLPVVVLSLGTFVLLRNKGEMIRCEAMWKFLDRHSFGIYLVHLIFLRMLVKVFKWNPVETGGVWMLIPVVIGVYAVSLLVVMILVKIPGVKRLL